MAESPLKFRCYQCNQLLGVPPKKAGSVIACPRCGAELLVPRPESEREPEPEPSLAEQLAQGAVSAGRSRSRARGSSADAESTRSETGSIPEFMNETGSAIPEDLVALRPEDIRVEAEFVDLVVTTSEPTSLASKTSAAPEPSGFSSEPISAETFLADVPPVSAISTQAAADQPLVDAVPGTVLPDISIEPPSILPVNRQTGPVREVLIQPAVLLIWSMVVLVSLPLSFIAGLLIGHFLWKVP